jgi:hypothetical protein
MSCKRKQKKTKIQDFMYRDTTNVEYEMYDYAGNNWSHLKSNKIFKKNLEAMPAKHSIYSLQKTSILGISHIVQKVPQSET